MPKERRKRAGSSMAVTELTAVSAFGVGGSADQVGWFVKHVIVPTWLRGSIEDKAATEAIVCASGIAFVIVRPAMLTDAAATGNVKVFQGHDTAHKITRADVVAILRRSADERRIRRRRGAIANS